MMEIKITFHSVDARGTSIEHRLTEMIHKLYIGIVNTEPSLNQCSFTQQGVDDSFGVHQTKRRS